MPNARRTRIVIPSDLAGQIDILVGKRGLSAFLVQAAERELMRLRQLKTLDAAAGAWKDKDHPESRTEARIGCVGVQDAPRGRTPIQAGHGPVAHAMPHAILIS